MKKHKIKNIYGFTLVELIIVITILAILATISFVSFQSYTGNSRDSNKITTLKTIQIGLDIFYVWSGKYPLPDGEITPWEIDEVEVAQKWVIWENISHLLKLSQIPTDPLTKDLYSYGVLLDQSEYQIGTTLESAIAQKSLWNTAYAKNPQARVIWNYKWYIQYKHANQTFVANIPSLLFHFDEATSNLLDWNQVYYVVDKNKNLPYAIGSTPTNHIPWSQTVKEIYGSGSSLTNIDITSVKEAKTREEKLIAIETLSNLADFWITTPEDFLNVVEKKPLPQSQTSNGNPNPPQEENNDGFCPENPTDSSYFTFSNGTITAYSDEWPKDVIIPCEIGGVSVTTIWASAFMNKWLTSVIIPNSVINIWAQAFNNNQLTSVKIPNSVTGLNWIWIFRFNQLTSVTLSSGITAIPNNTFADNHITSINIPPSVTIIWANAFLNNQLSSVVIPNWVTTINNSAFSGNQLTSVTLPSTLASIVWTTPFWGVTSFTNYDGYTSPYAYVPYESGIKILTYAWTPPTNFVLPESINGKSVTAIWTQAFYQKDLSSVIIPSSVELIQTSAFIINKITSVKILNPNTIIENSAFQSQTFSPWLWVISYASETQKNTYHTTTYVDTVKFPYAVVWEDTSWLPTLNCPENPTDSQYFTFMNDAITNYSNDGPKDVVIPCQINWRYVTSINGGFINKGLTSVIIPSSVTSIGDLAFLSNQLTSVTIPNSVTSIGNSVFANNQLTSVTIPDSVTSIGNEAFLNNQLTSVTIPDSVTSIGTSAFHTNKITSVSLSKSLTSLPNNIFYENKLTSVTIPDSVTSIWNNAFYRNELTTLVLPDSVVTLGLSAFSWNKLSSVIISDSVTTIGNGAFNGNYQLATLQLWNSVTTIGNNAFMSGLLTSLTIPNSVTSIGSNAFNGNSLTSITIPASVTSIWADAFRNTRLTSIIILNPETTIWSNAFTNQTNSLWSGTVTYASEAQRNTYHNTGYVDTAKLPTAVVQ